LFKKQISKVINIHIKEVIDDFLIRCYLHQFYERQEYFENHWYHMLNSWKSVWYGKVL